MDETKVGRRERRRRKAETNAKGNHLVENEFQKEIENVEVSIKPHVTQSLGKLVRRDTYTVLHSKSDFDVSNLGDIEQDFNVKSGEASGNVSPELRTVTYSLSKDSEKINRDTYDIEGLPDQGEIRPIPAPRRWKSINLQSEKVSSDTDRDVTEIDLDDLHVKSSKSDLSSKPSSVSNKSLTIGTKSDKAKNDLVVAPIPKPRKTVKNHRKPESEAEKSKSDHFESLLDPKSIDDLEETSVRSYFDQNSKNGAEPSADKKSTELPLVTDLQDKAKSDEVKLKEKRQKKSRDEPLDRKGRKKKSKTFSSLIKLEKKKIPKISTISKDAKEKNKENKAEAKEDKTDFQIDSPHYTESAENGRIYVQGKNGFHVMERDEVLKKGNQNKETEGNGGMMENSTVKTAILFQKYWSRSMTYLHGVLAGFGFSHAATVTAIMLHFNYEPESFIAVYSSLSLKIHYVFYTLIALCIVSCFDRIDIGHMNRRHWQIAWKAPSMWIILGIYIISFVLTFANQKTEARFEALPGTNETEIWNGQSQNEIQVSLLEWYHTVWIRDTLVLFAWLMIAFTTFDDFLFSHINNMAKYAEVKGEEKNVPHRTDYF